MAAATDFLAFGFKHTDGLDIKTPLMKYVTAVYGQERAEDISHDIDEVMRRRSEVANIVGGKVEGSKKDVKEVYARLVLEQNGRHCLPFGVQLLSSLVGDGDPFFNQFGFESRTGTFLLDVRFEYRKEMHAIKYPFRKSGRAVQHCHTPVAISCSGRQAIAVRI